MREIEIIAKVIERLKKAQLLYDKKRRALARGAVEACQKDLKTLETLAINGK